MFLIIFILKLIMASHQQHTLGRDIERQWTVV